MMRRHNISPREMGRIRRHNVAEHPVLRCALSGVAVLIFHSETSSGEEAKAWLRSCSRLSFFLVVVIQELKWVLTVFGARQQGNSVPNWLLFITPPGRSLLNQWVCVVQYRTGL